MTHYNREKDPLVWTASAPATTINIWNIRSHGRFTAIKVQLMIDNITPDEGIRLCEEILQQLEELDQQQEPQPVSGVEVTS